LPHQHPVMHTQQQSRPIKIYVDVVSQNAYVYNTGWQKSGLVGSVENLPYERYIHTLPVNGKHIHTYSYLVISPTMNVTTL